jgi:hypothetical protein
MAPPLVFGKALGPAPINLGRSLATRNQFEVSSLTNVFTNFSQFEQLKRKKKIISPT